MSGGGKGGHVFLVRGDLTHLACDDWLIPTDRELTLTESWLPAFAGDAVRRGDDGIPRLAGGEAVLTETRRIAPAPDKTRGRPDQPSPLTHGRPWLLDVGSGREVDAGWLVAGVTEWLDAATREHGSDSDTGRARRLLALPLVGTGAGGASERRDAVLEQLLPALAKHADRHGVDVALVLNDVRDLAAAEHVRQRRGGDCWDLDHELAEAAERLAERAADGRLALFLGAGVSRAAGLPLWEAMVAELLEQAEVPDSDRDAVGRLDAQDQVEYVARTLDGGQDALVEWVGRRFGPRPHALAHALLAALPVEATVTTNWDPLFEQAVADTGSRLAVLPYDDPGEADRWLLKLHGDASRGDGIVVRREDYLRFTADRNALAGVVQALLLTRHLLFVGFSFVDDNVIRIADEVTRTVQRRLGTTLALRPDPAKQALWPHLDHLALAGADEDEPERARRLEVFLDLLSAKVRRPPAYLLDDRYAGLRSDPEQDLADRLAALASDAQRYTDVPAWRDVRVVLDTLGHTRGDKN